MKKVIVLVILILIFLPFIVFAQDSDVTVSRLSYKIIDTDKAYEENNTIIMNYFGAKVEYTYEIKNNLDKPIEVSSISGLESDKDYLKYTIEDLENGTYIGPKKSIAFKVVTEVVEGGNDLIEPVYDKDLNINISFIETALRKEEIINETKNETKKEENKNESIVNETKNETSKDNIKNETKKDNQQENNNATILNKKEENIEQSKTLDNIGIYTLLILTAVIGIYFCFVYLKNINVLNMKSISVGSLIVVISISGVVMFAAMATDSSIIDVNISLKINCKNSYFLKEGTHYSIHQLIADMFIEGNYTKYITDLSLYEQDANQSKYDFFNGEIIPDNIKISQIIFEKLPNEDQDIDGNVLGFDSYKMMAEENASIIDLSTAQDYSILGILEDDTNMYDNVTKTGFCSDYLAVNKKVCDNDISDNINFKILKVVSNQKIYLNENSRYIFSSYGIMDTAYTYNFEGVENIDTSYVKYMDGLFAGFGFDVNKVPESIGTYGKQWLKLFNLNTDKVENMQGMFSNTKFDFLQLGDGINTWNTSKVKNMNFMFQYCPYSVLNVNALNTSSCESMIGMFRYYGYGSSSGDENIFEDLTRYNVSNVKNMAYMFDSFGNLPASSNPFSKLSSFYSDEDLYRTTVSLNVSNWDARNVTNFTYMFNNFGRNASVIDIKLSDRDNEGNEAYFKTEKGLDYSYMFANSKGDDHDGYDIDLTGFDTTLDSINDTNITINMSNMFNANTLRYIYVGDNWSTKRVSESKNIFGGTSSYLLPKYYIQGNKGTICQKTYGIEFAHIDEGIENQGCLSRYDD